MPVYQTAICMEEDDSRLRKDEELEKAKKLHVGTCLQIDSALFRIKFDSRTDVISSL